MHGAARSWADDVMYVIEQGPTAVAWRRAEFSSRRSQVASC